MIAPPGIPGALDCNEWKEAMHKLTLWTESVMSEDRVACEAFQGGVRHAEKNGYLGYAEERVRHLQTSLLKDIEQEQNAVQEMGL
jgi:hypothetical protein